MGPHPLSEKSARLPLGCEGLGGDMSRGNWFQEMRVTLGEPSLPHSSPSVQTAAPFSSSSPLSLFQYGISVRGHWRNAASHSPNQPHLPPIVQFRFWIVQIVQFRFWIVQNRFTSLQNVPFLFWIFRIFLFRLLNCSNRSVSLLNCSNRSVSLLNCSNFSVSLSNCSNSLLNCSNSPHSFIACYDFIAWRILTLCLHWASPLPTWTFLVFDE